jgi:hypothetical protein
VGEEVLSSGEAPLLRPGGDVRRADLRRPRLRGSFVCRSGVRDGHADPRRRAGQAVRRTRAGPRCGPGTCSGPCGRTRTGRLTSHEIRFELNQGDARSLASLCHFRLK